MEEEELEIEVEIKSKKRPFEDSGRKLKYEVFIDFFSEPQVSSKRFMSEIAQNLFSKLTISDYHPFENNYERLLFHSHLDSNFFRSHFTFRFIQKNFKRTSSIHSNQISQLNQQLKVQILSSELGVPMNINFFAFAYKVLIR